MPNRATGLPWDRVVDMAPEPDPERGTRGGLSTQAIVDTAIAIADVDGLDAVSIRRVAAILEVRPMSLYTHIVSKDELLDLMANELVGLMLVEQSSSGDWREALSEIARASHAAFVAHPWVLAAFARRPQPGPNAGRHAKQMASAVAGLGLAPDDVWTVLGIVDDYVLGHALRVATSGNASDLEASLTESDRAAQPELTALPGVDEARITDDGFEVGLQTVLDGVERRFAAATQPPAVSGSE
ncbi:MAG TPA: TetR/AcrR family transcriptional regulator C-terminal domain-containing protein [Conexibacter sp.]|jgi:AcrR family transcriptional regulator|nr:TetR/AcrR family transcriptional regulator C-terminal domain-containing protein [Conexibacter sp.]